MGQKGHGATQSSAEGRRANAADHNPCPTHHQKILTRQLNFLPGFNQEITGLVFAKGEARRNHGGRAVLGNDRRPS